jgi:hypothetical protein
MRPQSHFCFVLMPFRSDLNFFYLYIRKYLQDRHGLRVERADHRILTKPLLQKIRDQISEADVILADITGRNANVFYELGLADAYGKPVIVITQDPPSEAPADIRHLEFIEYDLAKDREFLTKLDNAIHNVFAARYHSLYERARSLLHEFNTDTGSIYAVASEEGFRARVMKEEQTQGIPELDQEFRLSEFLLPRILQETADLAVMRRVTEWLAKKFREKK